MCRSEKEEKKNPEEDFGEEQGGLSLSLSNKVTFVPHFDVMIYFILLIFQLPIFYIECIFSKKDRERENWGIVALGLKFFASTKRNDSCMPPFLFYLTFFKFGRYHLIVAATNIQNS